VKHVLPVKCRVSLIISDILGKEITKLVNEEHEAGYYEVKFNGGKLASRVYIYRITAGDF